MLGMLPKIIDYSWRLLVSCRSFTYDHSNQQRP